MDPLLSQKVTAKNSFLSPGAQLSCFKVISNSKALQRTSSFSQGLVTKDDIFMKRASIRDFSPLREGNNEKQSASIFPETVEHKDSPKVIFKNLRKGILIRRNDRPTKSQTNAKHQRHTSMQLFIENHNDIANEEHINIKSSVCERATPNKVESHGLYQENDERSASKKSKKVSFVEDEEEISKIRHKAFVNIFRAPRIIFRSVSNERGRNIPHGIRGEKLNPQILTKSPIMGIKTFNLENRSNSVSNLKGQGNQNPLNEVCSNNKESSEVKRETPKTTEKSSEKESLKDGTVEKQGAPPSKVVPLLKLSNILHMETKSSQAPSNSSSPAKCARSHICYKDDLIFPQGVLPKIANYNHIELLGERIANRHKIFNDKHQQINANENERKRVSSHQNFLSIRGLMADTGDKVDAK